MILQIVNFQEGKDEHDNNKIIVLENLLQAHRERNHIVIGNRTLLKKLIELNCLSYNGNQTLNEVISQSREYKSLLNEFEVTCDVDFSSTGRVENVSNFTNKKIILSFDLFIKSSHTQPSTLIAENDTDFDLYNYIARSFIKSNKNLNVDLNFQKNCGYGSHCYRVFSDLREDKKFALCIVDSDEKYPGAAKGSTAKPFGKMVGNIKETVEASILRVREAESLLPLNIISKTITKKGHSDTMISIFDKVNKLNLSSDGKFRDFFDHKEGIKLSEAIKPTHESFWKPFFQSERLINVKDCYQSSTCTDCGDCLEIKGFGNHILEQSLGTLKTENKITVIKSLSEQIAIDWKQLGKKVTAWGCVPHGRKRRAT